METVARTPTGEGIVIAVGCRQLTSRLKTPKPGHETGLCVDSGVQPSGSVDKNAHSKKAFPIGKAFKLVAERTGLEPATP
ncbi:hypothetical protein ODY53_07245, partial [Aeromonas veronii]|uniref:hypothetical protein n=1 Tax=Aeromonas veronii TaxID=654 RepID=UPI0022485C9D